MSLDIVVKKGLDLRLVGKPSREIEESKFSTQKLEKSGFFDENFFSSPPIKFSRAGMSMTKVWKMLP